MKLDERDKDIFFDIVKKASSEEKLQMIIILQSEINHEKSKTNIR